jgi:hypothetical protein
MALVWFTPSLHLHDFTVLGNNQIFIAMQDLMCGFVLLSKSPWDVSRPHGRSGRLIQITMGRALFFDSVCWYEIRNKR